MRSSSSTLGVHSPKVLSARSAVWLGVLLVAAGIAGCGGGGETLYPVTGKVTYQGNPVPRGNVTLHPIKAKGNISDHRPVGRIEDGSFKIFMPSAREGAPPGWYKVTVMASEEVMPGKGAAPGLPKYIVPDSYKHEATTTLEIEVRPDLPPQKFDLVGKLGGGGGTR